MENIANAPDIKFVEMDDWVMLYLDGKLVEEAHSIPTWRMLEILGIKYETHYPCEGAEAYTMCYGNLDGADTWEGYLKRCDELKDWKEPE